MARYGCGGIDIKRFNLISDEINAAPTDRHLGVIAGVLLENLLYDLLSSFLIDDPLYAKEQEDEIFGSYGPLATFGLKIKMAFHLGLISEIEYNLLRIVKFVRDRSAHSLGLEEQAPVDFSHQELVNKIRDAFPPKWVKMLPVERRKALEEQRQKLFTSENSKEWFKYFVHYISLCLLVRKDYFVEHRVVPKDINEDVDEDKTEDAENT